MKKPTANMEPGGGSCCPGASSRMFKFWLWVVVSVVAVLCVVVAVLVYTSSVKAAQDEIRSTFQQMAAARIQSALFQLRETSTEMQVLKTQMETIITATSPIQFQKLTTPMLMVDARFTATAWCPIVPNEVRRQWETSSGVPIIARNVTTNEFSPADNGTSSYHLPLYVSAPPGYLRTQKGFDIIHPTSFIYQDTLRATQSSNITVSHPVASYSDGLTVVLLLPLLPRNTIAIYAGTTSSPIYPGYNLTGVAFVLLSVHNTFTVGLFPDGTGPPIVNRTVPVDPSWYTTVPGSNVNSSFAIPQQPSVSDIDVGVTGLSAQRFLGFNAVPSAADTLFAVQDITSAVTGYSDQQIADAFATPQSVAATCPQLFNILYTSMGLVNDTVLESSNTTIAQELAKAPYTGPDRFTTSKDVCPYFQSSEQLISTVVLSFGGRFWRIIAAASPDYIANRIPHELTLRLIAMLLVSVIFVVVTALVMLWLRKHELAAAEEREKRAAEGAAHQTHDIVLQRVLHELSNPLHVIFAVLDSMETDGDEITPVAKGADVQLLATAAREMEYVLRSIQISPEVYLANYLRSRGVTVRSSECDVRGLVRDVVNQLSRIAPVPLVSKIAPAVPKLVWLDRYIARFIMCAAVAQACVHTAPKLMEGAAGGTARTMNFGSITVYVFKVTLPSSFFNQPEKGRSEGSAALQDGAVDMHRNRPRRNEYDTDTADGATSRGSRSERQDRDVDRSDASVRSKDTKSSSEQTSNTELAPGTPPISGTSAHHRSTSIANQVEGLRFDAGALAVRPTRRLPTVDPFLDESAGDVSEIDTQSVTTYTTFGAGTVSESRSHASRRASPLNRLYPPSKQRVLSLPVKEWLVIHIVDHGAALPQRDWVRQKYLKHDPALQLVTSPTLIRTQNMQPTAALPAIQEGTGNGTPRDTIGVARFFGSSARLPRPSALTVPPTLGDVGPAAAKIPVSTTDTTPTDQVHSARTPLAPPAVMQSGASQGQVRAGSEGYPPLYNGLSRPLPPRDGSDRSDRSARRGVGHSPLTEITSANTASTPKNAAGSDLQQRSASCLPPGASPPRTARTSGASAQVSQVPSSANPTAMLTSDMTLVRRRTLSSAAKSPPAAVASAQSTPQMYSPPMRPQQRFDSISPLGGNLSTGAKPQVSSRVFSTHLTVSNAKANKRDEMPPVSVSEDSSSMQDDDAHVPSHVRHHSLRLSTSTSPTSSATESSSQASKEYRLSGSGWEMADHTVAASSIANTTAAAGKGIAIASSGVSVIAPAGPISARTLQSGGSALSSASSRGSLHEGFVVASAGTSAASQTTTSSVPSSSPASPPTSTGQATLAYLRLPLSQQLQTNSARRSGSSIASSHSEDSGSRGSHRTALSASTSSATHLLTVANASNASAAFISPSSATKISSRSAGTDEYVIGGGSGRRSFESDVVSDAQNDEHRRTASQSSVAGDATPPADDAAASVVASASAHGHPTPTRTLVRPPNQPVARLKRIPPPPPPTHAAATTAIAAPAAINGSTIDASDGDHSAHSMINPSSRMQLKVDSSVKAETSTCFTGQTPISSTVRSKSVSPTSSASPHSRPASAVSSPHRSSLHGQSKFASLHTVPEEPSREGVMTSMDTVDSLATSHAAPNTARSPLKHTMSTRRSQSSRSSSRGVSGLDGTQRDILGSNIGDEQPVSSLPRSSSILQSDAVTPELLSAAVAATTAHAQSQGHQRQLSTSSSKSVPPLRRLPSKPRTDGPASSSRTADSNFSNDHGAFLVSPTATIIAHNSFMSTGRSQPDPAMVEVGTGRSTDVLVAPASRAAADELTGIPTVTPLASARSGPWGGVPTTTPSWKWWPRGNSVGPPPSRTTSVGNPHDGMIVTPASSGKAVWRALLSGSLTKTASNPASVHTTSQHTNTPSHARNPLSVGSIGSEYMGGVGDSTASASVQSSSIAIATRAVSERTNAAANPHEPAAAGNVHYTPDGVSMTRALPVAKDPVDARRSAMPPVTGALVRATKRSMSSSRHSAQQRSPESLKRHEGHQSAKHRSQHRNHAPTFGFDDFSGSSSSDGEFLEPVSDDDGFKHTVGTSIPSAVYRRARHRHRPRDAPSSTAAKSPFARPGIHDHASAANQRTLLHNSVDDVDVDTPNRDTVRGALLEQYCSPQAMKQLSKFIRALDGRFGIAPYTGAYRILHSIAGVPDQEAPVAPVVTASPLPGDATGNPAPHPSATAAAGVSSGVSFSVRSAASHSMVHAARAVGVAGGSPATAATTIAATVDAAGRESAATVMSNQAIGRPQHAPSGSAESVTASSGSSPDISPNIVSLPQPVLRPSSAHPRTEGGGVTAAAASSSPPVSPPTAPALASTLSFTGFGHTVSESTVAANPQHRSGLSRSAGASPPATANPIAAATTTSSRLASVFTPARKLTSTPNPAVASNGLRIRAPPVAEHPNESHLHDVRTISQFQAQSHAIVLWMHLPCQPFDMDEEAPSDSNVPAAGRDASGAASGEVVDTEVDVGILEETRGTSVVAGPDSQQSAVPGSVSLHTAADHTAIQIGLDATANASDGGRLGSASDVASDASRASIEFSSLPIEREQVTPTIGSVASSSIFTTQKARTSSTGGGASSSTPFPTTSSLSSMNPLITGTPNVVSLSAHSSGAMTASELISNRDSTSTVSEQVPRRESKESVATTTGAGTGLPLAAPAQLRERRSSAETVAAGSVDSFRHASALGTMSEASSTSATRRASALGTPIPSARGSITGSTTDLSRMWHFDLNVLVVEDDLSIQKLTGRFLTKLGCTWRAVSDGDQVLGALEAAEDTFGGVEKSCDVILMDIVMPHMRGDECTTLLRRSGYTMPIIAVTANARPSDVEHYLRCGATGVCAKPFTIATIRQALIDFVIAPRLGVAPPEMT